MENKWGDKRFLSLNYFLREKFGEKVYKICLDGGFSCPNRDGTLSDKGCIFCSERGSGDFAGSREFSISKQFEDEKKMMESKWKKGKYIAYFQAYTNTYDDIKTLKEKYEEGINNEDVVALAIATRPDCLSDSVIELLKSFNDRLYLWVELGLQTSNEKTANIINRGYKNNVFEEAVKRLKDCNIDVVTHVIFGLPGETHEDMINTIKYINKFPINGIKIHLLHILKNTPLEKLYKEEGFRLLQMNEYVSLICEAITLLPPKVVIHRLTGDAPRDLLVEPQWSLKKWEILNSIDSELNRNNLYQGLYYCTKGC